MSTAGQSISTRLSLQALTPQELPSHPLLAKLQTQQEKLPSLQDFVFDLLQSAENLIDHSLAKEFKKKGSPKSSPPSTAPVQLFSHDMNGGTWFARVSKHTNEAKVGSASWEEFVDSLYNDHSVHEADYTPNIYDAVKVLDWNDQLEETKGEIEPGTKAWQKWQNISSWNAVKDLKVEVYEMAHHIPRPLSNRVFCTLVVRALSEDEQAKTQKLVVAQVPADFSKLPEAMYSNGRNRKDGSTVQEKEKVVIGQYTSVEKVELSTTDGSNGIVTWSMATASDARGNLPMAMQKMGVPSAIVKDVGFVLKWTTDRRNPASASNV